jgi:CO dehydrogenase maturation factor
MRIAIAGKGGSGKTTIAGTLARLLARKGRAVVAVDGDTNPNLAQVLGVPRERLEELSALPTDLLVRKEDAEGNPYTELALPVGDVVERYGFATADGVQLLLMACVDHAGKGCKCRPHAIARNFVGAFDGGGGGDVIVDMEAGVEHLSRGTTRHVDILLAIAEPYFRSMETARRICELASELGIPQVGLIANKVRDDLDRDAIRALAERNGLTLEAEVPFDPAVTEADRRACGLLDVADADSPAVRALERLAESLPASRVPAPT